MLEKENERENGASDIFQTWLVAIAESCTK